MICYIIAKSKRDRDGTQDFCWLEAMETGASGYARRRSGASLDVTRGTIAMTGGRAFPLRQHTEKVRRPAATNRRGSSRGNGASPHAATIERIAAALRSGTHHGAKNTSVRFVRLPALVCTKNGWNDDDGSTSSPW